MLVGDASRLVREAPKKTWMLRSALAPYRHGDDCTVVSADGTRLAVRRTGRGAPVVLVHGTLVGKDSGFLLTEPALAEDFTVWSYDRRGRGDSDDGPDYALDREVEDLLAVIVAAGSRPHVVAHSFGAVCALVAAQRGADVRSLTLYEPPLRHGQRDEAAVERVGAAVNRGDLDTAMHLFFELADGSQDDVSMMRAMRPIWKRMRAASRTLPRELEALRGWDWSPHEWSLPDTPMLLIGGAETEGGFFPTLDELREAFPHAEVDVIPGQRHLAMGFAPWRFAEGVLDFLRRH